ncbi:hypothetical protein [Staphylococcus sp. 10602379]|uniref:hypothetical protein n=1 Tax=Staphylococcus sp. 10602379 TaxID=2714545 RepID=UPI0014040592|nr:hypothetical protein [Staphylococcus sp. 10602379]NHM92749.1 hypothetical protein [Staphylococcus sp. 10602379]
MNSKDILINMFPDALQQIIRHQRYDDILGYFLEENINDSKLAYHLSVLATHIDTIPCHESVETLFHFHFNYLKTHIIWLIIIFSGRLNFVSIVIQNF